MTVIRQPVIDFTPDKLHLITEALEQLGHSLIYDYDEIDRNKLNQTAELYEELNAYLCKCNYA